MTTGYKCLNDGERVEFDIEEGDDGRKRASNVTGANGSRLQGIWGETRPSKGTVKRWYVTCRMQALIAPNNTQRNMQHQHAGATTRASASLHPTMERQMSSCERPPIMRTGTSRGRRTTLLPSKHSAPPSAGVPLLIAGVGVNSIVCTGETHVLHACSAHIPTCMSMCGRHQSCIISKGERRDLWEGLRVKYSTLEEDGR